LGYTFIYPSNYLYSSAATFVCNHGLTQFVDELMRGNNVLDLILCSDTLRIDDLHILPPLVSSDYSLVSFTLLLSIQHPRTPPDDYFGPNFAKADWIGIYSYLNVINWHSAFVDCNLVEQHWDVFYSAISVAIDTYVPFFKNTRHTMSPK